MLFHVVSLFHLKNGMGSLSVSYRYEGVRESCINEKKVLPLWAKRKIIQL